MKELIFQDILEIEKEIWAAKNAGKRFTEIASKLSGLIGRKPTLEELTDFQNGGSLISSAIEKAVESDTKKFNTNALLTNFKAGMAEILSDLEALRIDIGAITQETVYPYRHHSISNYDYKDGVLTLSKQFEATVKEKYSLYVTDGSKRSEALELARTAVEALNELDAFIKKELEKVRISGVPAVQALENENGAPGLIDYVIQAPDNGEERAFLHLDRFVNIPDEEESIQEK